MSDWTYDRRFYSEAINRAGLSRLESLKRLFKDNIVRYIQGTLKISTEATRLLSLQYQVISFDLGITQYYTIQFTSMYYKLPLLWNTTNSSCEKGNYEISASVITRKHPLWSCVISCFKCNFVETLRSNTQLLDKFVKCIIN